MKAAPARFVHHVRVESGYIRQESDNLDMVLGARPVYGETTVKINKIRKLWVCLTL